MSTWFECKVKYKKMMPNGRQKRVNESYLIDAVSFSDAEARIHEVLEPYISGDFFVNAIKIANYSDIIKSNWSINAVDAEANKIMGINQNQSPEADKWFNCKVNFISYDEERGTERKTSSLFLVNANSVNSAHDTLIESLTGMVFDYEIEKVGDSKIIDVFPYSENISDNSEQQ